MLPRAPVWYRLIGGRDAAGAALGAPAARDLGSAGRTRTIGAAAPPAAPRGSPAASSLWTGRRDPARSVGRRLGISTRRPRGGAATPPSTTALPRDVQRRVFAQADLEAARSDADAAAGRNDVLQRMVGAAPFSFPPEVADALPAGVERDAQAPTVAALVATLAACEDRASPPLPAGWVCGWSAAHGCYYYGHEASGETSWERPG